MNYLTCIHQQNGLCPDCQAEYDADPDSWIEFGQPANGCRGHGVQWRSFKRGSKT